MAKTIEEAKAEIKTDIDKVTVNFENCQKKGFKIEDIATFAFEAGTSLIEAVENVEGLTGEEKKEVVVSSVKEIYKKVNPDIPMIPEPFETLAEDIILDKALNKFIDAVVKKYNEKGIFKNKNKTAKLIGNKELSEEDCGKPKTKPATKGTRKTNKKP